MLKIKIHRADNTMVAICNSDVVIIDDGQSALDFAVNIGCNHNCRNLAINKAAISEDFFKLSTGIAGEVTQKLVNYGYRLAIIGDFSCYTSKPLHNFIYESNKGKHIYFAADENEAIKKLGD